ncbi:T9SS type A sorting domain-containing protein [Chryseobacterium sp. POL2]|uniref:T9SS type A sorting domain-containing protein n=1 Tax=Chryseobacterium sp. POL2 TaxID=2713414 RepID=UPI0013E1243B|nr:T9SS type A sorting domain-containing protein [Chryseobacterium sp. POL2]QIG89307.1 T9SS type A sorting domain-containing protein [Chryseobacterium sp. POL2]
MLFNQTKAQSIHVFENYGPPIVSVNDLGKAITPSTYYDFATNTFTPVEPNIVRLFNINNNGDVTGSIEMLDNPSNVQPAYKLSSDTEWQRIPWFEESDPTISTFDIGNISSNGRYVVGYMSVGSTNFGSFVFNTETKQFTKIIDATNSVYKTIRLYGINNNGIAVGYVTKTGQSTRIPMYMNLQDQVVHELQLGNIAAGVADMSYDINNNNVIVGRIGSDFGFRYNISTQHLSTFDYPDNPYPSYITNLTHISDNGIAVGYATISISPIYTEAIIIDPSKDPNKIFYISDYLAEKGISYETPDGMAILGNAFVISDNGRYIGGYCNGNVPGWMVDLGGPNLSVNQDETSAITIFPNPTKDYFSLKGITDFSKISIFSTEGKLVKSFNSKQDSYDISDLSIGIYLISIKNKQGKNNLIRLIKSN